MSMIEPNCHMPWKIYLDWLQDQGNEDLRGLEIIFVNTPEFLFNLENNAKDLSGEGDTASRFESNNGDGYSDGHFGYGDSYGFFYDYSIGCEFLDEVTEEYNL